MPTLPRFGLGLSLLLLLACELGAQVNTANILGTVTDPTGATVLAARITVRNEGTGFTRSAVSDGDGAYLVPLLPVGDRYRVTIEAGGFKTFSRSDIVLQLRENVRVDAQLQIGQVTETVEVSGGQSLVETYSTIRGEVIENKRITELPLNGRNPLQLAALVTGVTSISTRIALDAGNRNGNYVNVNGSRSNETDYQLNGVRFAGSYTNSGLNYPNPDALQEFKLITNPNSAEYGMWSGAVFTAVTRSGTNQLHASLFEFLRNDKLNARNFFAATVPTLRQNQFGASGGGPIIKNRLFAFGAYQGLRLRNQILASSFPLTADERSGLITSATPVRDPNSGQPFTTDAQGRYIIPQNRFDPVSRNLLEKFVPVAPASTVSITNGSRKVDVNQFTGKFDYQISERDQLNVSGLYDRTVPFNPFYLGPYPSYGNTDERQRVYVLTVAETHTFAPNLINEFRFGVSGQEELRTPANQTTPSALGMKNWNYNYLPEDERLQAPTIGLSGRFTIGNSGFSKWREGGDNMQFQNNLSWVRGKHNMRMGVDYYHRTHHLDANVCDTGCLTATGAVTGNATADFLLGGLGSATRIRYLNRPGYRAWSAGYFFQDDWKVSRRLTLNLGLRWDLLWPFVEYRGMEDKAIEWNIHGGLPVPGHSGYEIGARSQVFPFAPPGLIYPGDKTAAYPGGVPDTMIPLDKKQIQPRVGLAWDVTGDGKTSIRTSFGFFTNAQFVDMPAQFGQNLPFIVIQGHNAPPGTFADPYRGLVQYPPITTAGITSDPAFFTPFLPAAGYGWDPNYRLPRVMNMAFSLQRQIIPNIVVEGAYVGKLSRHLQQTRNINTAVYIPGQSTIANTDSRRRLDNKNFQKIDYQDSGASAAFHSFQMTMRWQGVRGLTLLSSYTWSHSIDTWSTIGIQSALFQDPNNTRAERASSDFDRRHVYRASWMYDIPNPFGSRRSKAVDMLLANWQFTGILTAQSGTPLDIISGFDYSLTGAGRDRPDLVGDPAFSDSRSHGQQVEEYFRKSAFVRNQDGRFGNLGRNLITGPGYFGTDLGLFKTFAITEQHRLQFRTEFFNAFNQTNFGSPVTNLISPAFGRISSAADPRLVQFALKYSF